MRAVLGVLLGAGCAVAICDLARQLAGDDWAANKCESAKASCQAAHDSCCRCVL